MLLRRAALVLLLVLLAAPRAHAAVGFQRFTVADPQGALIEAGVWHPVAEPGGPVQGRGLPLVVISHGSGSDFLGHADTAAALAEAGFVVAALTHPGDNWRDRSGAMRIWDRPRQLGLLIDHMLQEWPGRDHLDPGRIGAFGFSAGGFAVLAAAGGEAEFSAIAPHCRRRPRAYECGLMAEAGTIDAASRPSPTHDARIRAIVVAAPALGYTFGRKGLAGVRLPVQLWRAEDDDVLPSPDYAEAVQSALPTPPESHIVPAAGHFDFLPPCDAVLARNAPQICVSAPGFDRAAFHAQFNRSVVAFFRRTLR